VACLAAHADDKRKAEFFRVGGVQFLEALELRRRQAVEAERALLGFRGLREVVGERRSSRKVRMAADQRELFRFARRRDRRRHGVEQHAGAPERPHGVGALGHPGRVLINLAQCAHEIRLAGLVQLFEGDRHIRLPIMCHPAPGQRSLHKEHEEESAPMNLARLLRKRAEEGRPVRVGVIGAGKFSSMFLAQVRTTLGMHLLALADLDEGRARDALSRTGWDADAQTTRDFDEARRTGKTAITADAFALIAAKPDVVVDIPGNPAAATRQCRKAFDPGCHVVNVTVEADALAGALLAERARQAGVVYSLAYGDQPALVCEMVDWAEACGFRVVAAGKGTKYLPGYEQSTPETVWPHYGITAEAAAAGGMNPQMFNSFLDGTKSAIE